MTQIILVNTTRSPKLITPANYINNRQQRKPSMNKTTMYRLVLFATLVATCLCDDTPTPTLKVLTKQEFQDLSAKRNGDTVWASETVSVPPDNGGNYGDLVYRARTNGDRLLVRDVVLLPSLDSFEQDIQWYTSISGARTISTVRVINIGRERAYTLRIDVAGQDAQVIFRVPSYQDPRLLIEVYGY